MAFNPIYLIKFVFFTVILSLSFLLGIKIMSKYFEHKKKEFLLVGITAIIVSEPWWVTPIENMLLFLDAAPLSSGVIQFITFFALPVGIFSWLFALTELIYKGNQKRLLIISAIYSVIFEVLFIPLTVTYPDMREHLPSLLIIGGYMFSFLIVTLVTGLLFARECIKSDDPVLRLKAQFLRVSFISFFLVSNLSFLFLRYRTLANNPLFLLMGTLLMISAFSFYFGFILPERIKKIFIK